MLTQLTARYSINIEEILFVEKSSHNYVLYVYMKTYTKPLEMYFEGEIERQRVYDLLSSKGEDE